MQTSRLHSAGNHRFWHMLVLAAFCAGLLLPTPGAVHAAGAKVGLITAGSVSDQGFNQMAHDGLLKAQTDLGIVPSVYESSGDYTADLQQCVSDGNVLCIGVGFQTAEAVLAAANANAGVHFATLDYYYGTTPANLRGIVFNEKEAGYLAGALAGKMTTANIVGAVGGMALPAVVAFLSGYQNGAQCANPDATVLLNYTGTFTDPTLGADTAADLISSGADVIFGAAGPTGNGAILYSAQNDVWSIGVDADQYLSVFGNGTVDGSDKLLTSAMKRLDNAVYDTISDQVGGTWTSGTLTYDLTDDGVGLAPYHEADSSISDEIKAYVNTVKAGIIAGTTDVNATCREHTQIGLVTDSGGVNDNSFNSMAWQGILASQTNFGITPMLYETSDSSQYAPGLAQCATDGNDLCFAVGFSMNAAVTTAAGLYPGTHFAILDVSPESPPSNLRGITFNTKEAAYLAGALAAQMTTSHTLGAIGGMAIPVVVDFMEGYQNGAQCTDRSANVLMNYTGTFTNPTLGASVAADMMSRGADVIFAPAGGTGVGAIQHSAQNGTWSIGVDTDEYNTVFGGGSEPGANKLLTSVMKNVDVAVHNTIVDEFSGIFTSGTVRYGLAMGGVGLAPYHDADASIPQVVKTYIDDLSTAISSGEVDVNYPCRPRFHAQVVEGNVVGYDWYPGWQVQLGIDYLGSGVGIDSYKQAIADANGTVVFNDLDGYGLTSNLVLYMSHSDTKPEYNIEKALAVSDLSVTKVNPATDTVSGTGPEGAWINVQRCDNTGCTWRRWVQVSGGQWTANFKVAGPGDDEKALLDIVPGMTGEALQPDADGDHTDYRWSAPTLRTLVSRSNGGQDGWVLETGEKTSVGGLFNATTPTFMLGDDASRKQYRGILSFTTSALPDTAVITSARLTLRKQAVTPGGDPFTLLQGLMIDVRRGFFSTSNLLQPLDFQAAASTSPLGLGPIKPAVSGTLYTLTLPTSAYNFINKLATNGGLTQLRLRFKLDDNNNAAANYVSFFSGNYATLTYRPTLTITYYVP